MKPAKKEILYSIIRYSPDILKGEIINVGLLFHNLKETKVKYFLLDEKSPKIKCIMDNISQVDLYRSYKEILEYYLEKSKDDMSGVVGNTHIGSYFQEDFIKKMYSKFEKKEMFLSMPNVAYTSNEDKLFETILKRYVGNNHTNTKKANTLTAKKYLKKIFAENEVLNKRVKSDLKVKPIKNLDDLEVKIDFTFKNGMWNYMQTIPRIDTKSKNTEWFSQTQLLLDARFEDTKIHLIYKESDILDDEGTYNLLRYLQNQYCNLEIHNIDKESSVKKLCNYIETEGEILEKIG
ncbi:DUF3037 domain-containing protein [Clostridium botulinum]|uniref:DUF3037 domain-containing protein n=1 Tax=Clostridium botulinum TaxID=1491 RepID=A0A846JEY6_CLOBO|nr:DUF3037 domain-containing protein [Clostridium botulinum]ACA55700.1 hypothetical protein CLK_1312 [Clostridium botulinum A3 str. Loch Maree]NFH66119.1 DUF3037 domain-containing protein [Clostridium botulinum]NFJ08734.1 DUF3037 domain-containing protein [Clostridium botulinum]NFK15130.1 DUF3037 domain-containing protein [Clostridium botulinum]NFM93090.1 DUF3037 domain-containing protein [Clostridium botulinum]